MAYLRYGRCACGRTCVGDLDAQEILALVGRRDSRERRTDPWQDVEREYFGGMPEKGATTFWEDFDTAWMQGSGNLDDFPQHGRKDIHGDFGRFCYEGYRHSLCHGWSSGAVAFLVEEIAGIRRSGGNKCEVQPRRSSAGKEKRSEEKRMERSYRNIVRCAKNEKPSYVPLYEHLVSDKIMEQLLGERFAGAVEQDEVFYFKKYCEFYDRFGYDAVSFEGCVTAVLPGGGALGEHKEPIIKTKEDFERYPFDEVEKLYSARFFKKFEALRKALPPNMKAIGGVGNGVFEIVQDLVGYEALCLLSYDDPETYAALFERVGQMLAGIWKKVLNNFGDVFCVCRFGDDLGYRSNTLLPPGDIRGHIIPQYGRIISLIKETGKPFLLHSCGCIFEIMDDLIAAGIDSKHSNEDAIAPFERWVKDYGDRIVPEYVEPSKYLAMLNEARLLRGEKQR